MCNNGNSKQIQRLLCFYDVYAPSYIFLLQDIERKLCSPTSIEILTDMTLWQINSFTNRLASLCLHHASMSSQSNKTLNVTCCPLCAWMIEQFTTWYIWNCHSCKVPLHWHTWNGKHKQYTKWCCSICNKCNCYFFTFRSICLLISELIKRGIFIYLIWIRIHKHTCPKWNSSSSQKCHI